jgi:hypothetical protein
MFLDEGYPSRGQALPPFVRAGMEMLFHADLRSVRVHADSPAPRAFGARALAFRDHIHCAPGEYDPWTSEGWRLLGHEIDPFLSSTREPGVRPPEDVTCKLPPCGGRAGRGGAPGGHAASRVAGFD